MKRPVVNKHATKGFIAESTHTLVADPLQVDPQWLAWQCQMLASCTTASLLKYPEKNSGQIEVTANWPKSSPEPALVSLQAKFAKEPQLVNQANACEIGGKSQDLIACPIKVGRQQYMLWVLSDSRPASQRQAMIHLLQWGGNCLLLLKDQEQQSSTQIQFQKSLLCSDDLEHCLTELCKQLCQRFACKNVYLLNTKRANVHSALCFPYKEILPKSELELQLKKIRDESFAQQSLISFPCNKESLSFKREHQRFGQHTQSAVCSVPIIAGGNRLAVLLLQKDEAFSSDDLESISLLPSLLAKDIESRIKLDVDRKPNKSVLSHVVNRKFALAACLLSIAILFAQQIEVTFEINAPAEVEGNQKQLLVAPHDGYIKEAYFRSGDEVKAGDVLAELDDLNLQLEKKQQLASMASLKSQYQAALSERDRVKLARYRAQMEKTRAELDIIEYQLKQQRLSSGFDGVVLKGDLSQRIGAPVKAAEVLYEIAAVDDYKVVLYVEEFDIAYLKEARSGEIRFTAFPDKTWTFSLLSVHPVSEIRDQKNVFRVEAKLDQTVSELKPGLLGYAQLSAGKHSLLWIWTRKTVTRLRLWLWKGVSW